MKKLIPQIEPALDHAEVSAVYSYMQSGGWIMEFTKTAEFEKMIAKFTGARYCVVTTSDTVGLILALLALNLSPGDEVIVPNLTMIATPNSAALLGIKPILVDIEPETLCLDLSCAGKKITPQTKALIYVPFNGRSGNMKKVVEFCQKHHLYLIEDAAQAFSSQWENKQLGTFGQIGTFSFSVPKIITTGQGGALIINNKKLYQKIKRLKDFGRDKGGQDIHNNWGWNFKFTDIQAVIGIEQLKKIKQRIKRKKEIYKLYQKELSQVKEIEFIPTDLTQTTPWFIDIYVSNPNKLMTYLSRKGIGSRRIYPPIAFQKIYRQAFKKDKFPVSEKYASRGLWLPSSVKLTNQEVKTITRAVRSFYRG
jgi:perosamine synthetase